MATCLGGNLDHKPSNADADCPNPLNCKKEEEKKSCGAGGAQKKNDKDDDEEKCSCYQLQKQLLTAIDDHWRGVAEELVVVHERKMGLTRQCFEKLLCELSSKFEPKESCVQVEEIVECYRRAKELGYPTTKCEHFVDKFTECFNAIKEGKINKLATGRAQNKKKKGK